MNIETSSKAMGTSRESYLPPRKHIKRLFRGSLIRLMEKRGYTSGHLSTLTGIGRSVIKTYTDDSLSLPNAYQLLRLANALECDISALLPSPMLKADKSTKKLTIEISKTLAVNEKAQEMFNTLLNLEGRYVYYAPKTLPEPLKIKAVIEKELGVELEPNEIEYFRKLNELLDVNISGCILIRQTQMDELIYSRGAYHHLRPAEIEEQVQALRTYEEQKFPNLQIRVMTTNAHNITDILLIENTIAYHEIFNNVITITDPEFLASATSFMNEQIKTSIKLEEYIDSKLNV